MHKEKEKKRVCKLRQSSVKMPILHQIKSVKSTEEAMLFIIPQYGRECQKPVKNMNNYYIKNRVGRLDKCNVKHFNNDIV